MCSADLNGRVEAGTRVLLTSRLADIEKTRPLEEAELRVNDLSVCKGHGSKGTGMIGSGKTPLTPWQSLPRVICCLPLSFSPPWVSLFSLFSILCLSLWSSSFSVSVSVFYSLLIHFLFLYLSFFMHLPRFFCPLPSSLSQIFFCHLLLSCSFLFWPFLCLLILSPFIFFPIILLFLAFPYLSSCPFYFFHLFIYSQTLSAHAHLTWWLWIITLRL